MIQHRSFLMPRYKKPITHSGFYELFEVPVLNRNIAPSHHISKENRKEDWHELLGNDNRIRLSCTAEP